MRKLVLMAALLAGCGDVTETMTADAGGEAQPTCAAPDKVTGAATIASIVGDVANPSPCYMDNWPKDVGLTERVPLPQSGGYQFTVIAATVAQAPTSCAYHWDVLVTTTILGSYMCKWTTAFDLTTAPQ